MVVESMSLRGLIPAGAIPRLVEFQGVWAGMVMAIRSSESSIQALKFNIGDV